MKKCICLLLVLVLCLSLVACGGEDKKAFEASKAAYDNIDIAYEIIEQYGSDIYEAWRMGIYDQDEIRAGEAYYVATILDQDWDTMSDEDKNLFIDNADSFFEIMEDDLFSFCVSEE